MSDFFIAKKSDISKKVKQNRIVENPILYKNSDNPEITFIIDKLIGKNLLEKFKDQFIKPFKPNLKYQILYCFKFKPLESDLKSNIHYFYNDNKINLQEYIKPWSKIITFGRTLYQMTSGSAELTVEGFYDFIFNKTYFFNPELKSWVFPVDYFFDLIDKDHFKSFFAKRQIQECEKFENKPIRIPKLECILVERPNDFLKEYIDKACEVAWDIETNSLDWVDGEIGCITMSFDGKIGYYLRWKDINKSILNDFFKNKYQIGNNLKFDCLYLRKQGITNVRIDWDNWQAGHYLNMEKRNSLKAQSCYYTNYSGYDKELDDYKRKYPKLKNYLEIPEPILFQYATMDSIISFQVYKKIKEQIEYNDYKYFFKNKWNLEKYLRELVFPTINSFVEIELEGMMVNWNKVKDFSKELDIKMKKLKKEIYEYFNIPLNSKTFNLESIEQLGKLLENKGWEKLEINKKGIYKTNNECLLKWKKLGYDIVNKILEYRELETLQKTFVGYEEKNSGFFQYRKKDNKVHSNFLVTLADSGRNKSRSPNLTNIPKHGEYAKEIRSFFTVPDEDYILLEVDGKSLQLAICASISKDLKMKEVFNTPGSDLHSVSAQSIFCPEISLEDFKKRRKTEKILDNYRFKAKSVNFSLVFNTTAKSFAIQSLEPDWSEQDAEDYLLKNKLKDKPIELFTKYGKENEELTLKFCKYWAVAIDIKKKFFNTYPLVKYWIENNIKFASENGYIVSPFGAYRLLTELLYQGKDSDYRIIKNLQNISCNTAVQNFEVFIMMHSINILQKEIKERNLKSRIVNNVHDSIVIYCHKSELSIIKKILKDDFEKDIPEKNGIPYILEGEMFFPLRKENKTYWGFRGEEW